MKTYKLSGIARSMIGGILCLIHLALPLAAQHTSRLTMEQSTDLKTWQSVPVTPGMIDANGKLLVPSATPERFYRMQVEILTPAGIATQPASTSIISGQTTTLTVAATGTGPFTYQWYEGSVGTTTKPVGTNSASFTTLALTETTPYWVRVSNALGMVNSGSVTVTVTQPDGFPSITTQPAASIIISGQITTLTVAASGSAPFTYEWYQSSVGTETKPVGTNSASFTTSPLTATTSYWVRVSNAVGAVDSSVATVTVIPEGLLAWWKFDGDLQDVGRLHPAVRSNATTFLPGQVGDGLNLGLGGYMEVADAARLRLQQFTIEGWVRPEGRGPNEDSAGSVIVSKNLSNTLNSVLLTWTQAGKFLFVTGNGVVNDGALSTGTFPAGQFYHVAMTSDGTTTRLFVDGASQGEFSLPGGISYNGIYDWTIGSNPVAFHPVYTRRFNGIIDDLAIYDRALSPVQVRDLARNRQNGKPGADTDADGDDIPDIIDPRPLEANRAPVPANLSFQISQADVLEQTETQLLIGAVDPDGDSFKFDSASLKKVIGGTVSLVAGVVTFQPDVGFTGAGGYTFDLEDRWGARATVTVTVTVTPEFALIAAGDFQMGDNFAEGSTEELPVHTVNVSAFYMGKYEVTKALWNKVRTYGAANGYTDLPTGGGKGANHPVISIRWYDMVKWCNARSERDNLTPCYKVSGAIYKTGNNDDVECDWNASGYRLPTEAEWEKAARGDLSDKRFPWGDTIMHSQANYYSSTSYTFDMSPTQNYHPTYATDLTPYSSPVGSFAPNGYGLYDMAGNISEWVWDWYGSGYYASSPSADPRGPSSGSLRMLRGGSWDDYALNCRVAYRSGNGPGYSHYGFRIARSSAP